MNLSEEYIPGIITQEDCHSAAVVMPVICCGGEKRLLFEVRSSMVSTQPGDICFPGGSLEEGETPREAAERECTEELLLKPGSLEILGPGKLHCGMCLTIYPYLAKLKDYEGSFNCEVAEVFTVPLDFFLGNEPEKHMMRWTPVLPEDFPIDLIQGGKDYRWRRQEEQQLFWKWQEPGGKLRIIWGLTARIIYHALVKDERLLELIEKI